MNKGLKILIDRYWSSNGWKDGNISNEDFEIAKSLGYMFDYPKTQSHIDTLKELKETLKQISKEDVANAFLYSLSTRKLEYRSALGSYWYTVAIKDHDLYIDNEKTNKTFCYLCGWTEWKKHPTKYDLNHGLNVYNFERYKFGGTRHTYLNYALFDLKQFQKLPKVTPTEQDKKIIKELLECTKLLQNQDKAGKLRNIILKNKIFKTNKDEVSIVLDILGICGILENKEFPCYQDHFANIYERAPLEYKNDFSYPINRWENSDGINYKRFEQVFNFKL